MAIRVGLRPEDVDIEFPVAPAGTYLCRISSQEVKDSKAGKPMIELGLTCINPVECHVGSKAKVVSDIELFRLYVSLAANALFSLKALQVACGDPNLGWRGEEVFPEEFLGHTINAQISLQEGDDGHRFNRVERVTKA